MRGRHGRRWAYWGGVLGVGLLLAGAVGCAKASTRPGPLASESTPMSNAKPRAPQFRTVGGFTEDARHLKRLRRSGLSLDSGELHTMQRLGFVVSARRSFDSPVRGYLEIYKADLPVYVTADLLLNQIECWFSILSRHVLARGSFTSTDDLAAKIEAYVVWYLGTDRPFCWSYRPKSWS